MERGSEAVSRAAAADPDGEGYASFTEVCDRHKDNFWQIVHPPDEEGDGTGSVRRRPPLSRWGAGRLWSCLPWAQSAEILSSIRIAYFPSAPFPRTT